jgi:hypothetical protein
MQALRVIQEVAADGYLHVKVPQGLGNRFELIILPLSEDEAQGDSLEYMKLQQESGFAKQVLASAEEDVWNDL